MSNTPTGTNTQRKAPIINCHTHIFTGDHVPPWLAKTFLPWPLYFLFPLSGIVRLFRWYYNGPYRWQFMPWYKKIARLINSWKAFAAKYFITLALKWLTGIFLSIHAVLIVYHWGKGLLKNGNPEWIKKFDSAENWLSARHVLLPVNGFVSQFLLVFAVLLFIPSGRNLIFFVLNKTWGLISKLPGKQTTELAARYLSIGRHAFHKKQARTFSMLKNQYPADTGFVVLPMDMEYMKAGKPKKKARYRQQMAELAAVRRAHPNNCYPFVFADPRRFVPATEEINYQPGDKIYFDYDIIKEGSRNKIVLRDCFIKDLVETHHFSGFKIYPALGYYPFDEKLLPLWKYAADNGLPVLTHCIRGTIYYRGWKKPGWYEHPVFEEFSGRNANGDMQFRPLILPERKNMNFSVNFTHPMNYLCLLEEPLLRKIIGRSTDQRLQSLFGYKDPDTALSSNLRHLKLCMGHFGGDDEWKNFLEKDRDNYSSKLNEFPASGLDFFNDTDNNASRSKTEQIWKGADWYTIICSMMLQYPQVYADISYILHQHMLITPLLTQTLQNPGLRKRVLFGTDFFVVRNHNSDKDLLGLMMGGLREADFDVIARENPREFLEKTIAPLEQT